MRFVRTLLCLIVLGYSHNLVLCLWLLHQSNLNFECFESSNVAFSKLEAEKKNFEEIKPDRRLVLVSCIHCCTSTPSLSTWWSSTVFQGKLILRTAWRLDAFSAYQCRT